ncbi:YbgF trimerization domain-containing protein, partial [Leclercia adecarboxylata]
MIVAAALVAAAPANAQRQSLADRVGALEQQANNNQSNMDMLNQLNQLRTQLQALQSQVEQLQHDNEQLKQTGKDQYLDLDSRLNRLEGGAPVLPAAPAAAATEDHRDLPVPAGRSRYRRLADRVRAPDRLPAALHVLRYRLRLPWRHLVGHRRDRGRGAGPG